jgi:hypothetical protein
MEFEYTHRTIQHIPSYYWHLIIPGRDYKNKILYKVTTARWCDRKYAAVNVDEDRVKYIITQFLARQSW